MTLVRAESAITTDRPVEINARCRAAAIDVTSQTPAREIDFAVERDAALLEVVGDATFFGEMLRNLLHNAFKCTPRRSTVTLVVRADLPACILVDPQHRRGVL